MGDYIGRDGYDYEYAPRRRPSPHYMRSEYHEDYLAPAPSYGLRRSRSHGHGPAPVVNVYNRMVQDNDQPNYPVYPPSRNSPEFRGRARLGEEIAENLADLALETRLRSRSRGRSDYSAGALAEYQLAAKEQEIKDIERRQAWEREEKRIREEMKLKQLESELKREHDEEAAKEKEKQLLADYQRKQREAQDKAEADERRIKDKIERDKAEAKLKEEQAERDFIRRQAEKKKEEEDKYNEFLRIQREKEDKKKKEEKEAEEHVQAEMRKRLANLGYSARTIDVMVDEEKAKKYREQVERKEERLEVFERTTRAPVYPKVHRDYIAVETLKYYDLPWEYDRNNPEYIIIMRDMDKHATDVLFEHTNKIRSKLLLEAPKKHKEYAWVRHRSKSRAGERERIGIFKVG